MADDRMEVSQPREGDEQAIADQEDLSRRMAAYNVARTYDATARKQYAIDRSYAAGSANADWAVDANLVGSYVDILVAFIYARDPSVRARPTEAAVRAQPRERQEFAKTLQIVIKRLWQKGKLKRAMKKATRAGYSAGIGWFKADILIDTKTDPVVTAKLNDVKDNLRAIQVLQQEMALTPDGKDPKQVELELRDQIKGLEARVEIILRKAFVIDFVRAENVTVSLNVGDIEDYLDADFIGVDIFVQKSELKERFEGLTDEDVRQAKTYYQTTPADYTTQTGGRRENAKPEDASQFTTAASHKGTPVMQDASGQNVEFAKVVELWCRKDSLIRTAIDGLGKWARPPFPPRYGTSRFYPLFKIDFFQVDGDRHPQSLSYRLAKLQDEYGSSRSNFRATRERMIPGVIVNGHKIEPAELKKITDGVASEYIAIKPTDPNAPMQDLFAAKPLPSIDWAIFDTAPIIGDMEKISGVQEAIQSSHTVEKTATQAEIEQGGFAARTTAQRDGVEDMLRELAEYTAEIALQCLSYQEVQKMAGELAFWPESLPLEEVTSLMDIEIEAGSTGRPNTAAEREAWAVILPEIKELVPLIVQARRSNDLEIATAYTEILRETLTRMGDRIDVERFIPGAAVPPELGAPTTGIPGAAPGAPGGPGGPPMPLPGTPGGPPIAGAPAPASAAELPPSQADPIQQPA